MWNKLWLEIASAHRFVVPAHPGTVSRAELAALPTAAQAYMRFFGIVPGTPKHWSFELAWHGRFRLGPERHWMPIEAVQYNTREPIARFFHMRARMAHVLPVLARDTYVDGRGHMRARLAGMFPIVDENGIELDLGELATWTDDAVLFAPTMLLGPATTWRDAGERAFELDVSDADRSVSARVLVGADGAPLDFETEDRFLADPDDPKHRPIRARWTTPVNGWQQGPLPVGVRSIWHLASGDFTYGEWTLDAARVAYDVLPPAAAYAA